jgi:DNA-binding NtrC family response regulator
VSTVGIVPSVRPSTATWHNGVTMARRSERRCPVPRDPILRVLGGPGTIHAVGDTRARVDVLVIDDDAHIASTAAAILRKAGLGVATAHTVDEALSMCGATRFDVVVIDHRLGDSDGARFMEAATDFGLAVVVSAEPVHVLDEVHARFAARVFAIRNKPLAPLELVDTVTAAIAETRRRAGGD